MIILGIDPGATGGVAFFDPAASDRVEAFDLPMVAGVVDGRNMADLVRSRAPDAAVIENVHSMPKQGVASSFKFGRNFGTCIGILEGLLIPLDYVAPTSWKKHFRLGSDKEQARALVLNRFPPVAKTFARKKDHGRAEASLLALYRWETRKA